MKLLVLPGDGIGPEITGSAIEVLDHLDRIIPLNLTYEVHEVGLKRLSTEGTTFPSSVLDACRSADGIILGPISHSDYPPRAQGGINLSADLRIELDLYANIRPCKSRKGLPHWGRTPMDLVIVRENTEGFYADRNMHLGIGEFMPTEDLALSVRRITAKCSSRIARTAFELARERKRKVTAVHKVNVLKISEALFLREVRNIATEFPDVAYEEQLVDSMAALLVRDAQRFDVIVTTNMFGDILSDEASELAGSLGLGCAINSSETRCMAQAQHGSAPDIAQQDKANPASLILSTAMLLDWLGRRHGHADLRQAGGLIEQAVDQLAADTLTRTQDLGGTLGTRMYTKALCREISLLGQNRLK